MWRVLRVDGSIFRQYNSRADAVADVADYLRDGMQPGERIRIVRNEVFAGSVLCFRLVRVRVAPLAW